MATTRQKTAAYRLFHFRYNMMIPQSFMYGREYIAKHGYHVSGDAQLDQARLMEPGLIRQTVAGLAILHNEGAPLDGVFVDHRDAVKAYNDIQEHLKDWERVVCQGIHPDDVPPIEEFRMFEAIALALYRSVKFHEPNEPSGDAFRDRIMAMNRSRNPAGTQRYLRSKITDDKGELKPYISVVDRIEKELMGDLKWQ